MKKVLEKNPWMKKCVSFSSYCGPSFFTGVLLCSLFFGGWIQSALLKWMFLGTAIGVAFILFSSAIKDFDGKKEARFVISLVSKRARLYAYFLSVINTIILFAHGWYGWLVVYIAFEIYGYFLVRNWQECES